MLKLNCKNGHDWLLTNDGTMSDCPVCGDTALENPPATEIVGTDQTKQHANAVQIDRQDRTDVVGTDIAGDPARTLLHTPDPASDTNKIPQYVPGYELIEEIGRGGMGVVFRAKQIGLQRTVALKMVLAGSYADSDHLDRFRIEAQAIADLQHPNIVQVFDVGENQGRPFFSLEFVNGRSLADKINSTPQPANESARLIAQCAQAIHLAHERGIIHRDLKPGNVLLTEDGTPKITDFGLAKRLETAEDGNTQTGSVLGTPSYMAPEQAMGLNKEIGPAADIYALGAILYELLTGRPPFRGASVLDTLQQVKSYEPVPPSRLQPSVPRDLETICLKTLEKDPRKRYHTAKEFGDDLSRFSKGEPIFARRTSSAERVWKWVKRKPAAAGLIAVAASALLTIFILAGLWLHSERNAAEERERQQAKLVQLEREKADQAKKLLALEKERAQQAEQLQKMTQDNYVKARAAIDKMLKQLEMGQTTPFPLPLPNSIFKPQLFRKHFLEQALKFYEGVSTNPKADPKMRFEAALAQKRTGEILQSLGRDKPAQQALQKAERNYWQLKKQFPKNRAYSKGWHETSQQLRTLQIKQMKNKQLPKQ